MYLFIKTQVLILSEEGNQQELINSNLVVSLKLFAANAQAVFNILRA